MPTDDLMSLCRHYPFLADLLASSMSEAARRGHSHVGDYHAFSVLITQYRTDAAVAVMLREATAEDVEHRLWGLVLVEKPIVAANNVTPSFLQLVYGTLTDSWLLRLGNDLIFATVAFFLTRSWCIPFTALQDCGIDREAAIRRLAAECSPERASAIVNYYAAMHANISNTAARVLLG